MGQVSHRTRNVGTASCVALPRPLPALLLRPGLDPVERLFAVLLLQRVHDLPHAERRLGAPISTVGVIT